MKFLLNIRKVMVLILLIEFLLGIAKVEFNFAVTHYNENIVKLYL